RGLPFARNEKTGDTRISGSLASLAGLQHALDTGDAEAIDTAIRVILLLHNLILSFGGIPLLYYGDEIGTVNDETYRSDPVKMDDSRWVHRPYIDWQRAQRRNEPETPEYGIFSALKSMIAIRKELQAFADFNNRYLLEVTNPHLFVFERTNPFKPSDRVLAVSNFDTNPQQLSLDEIPGWGHNMSLVDAVSGQQPDSFDRTLVIPALGFHWLLER